jgi:hypothetical protein
MMRSVLVVLAFVPLWANGESVRLCRSGDLSASSGGPDAALGSLYSLVFLRNVSPRTCLLRGVPRVTALDEAGKTVPSRVTGNADSTIFGPGANEFRLQPGHAAAIQIVTVNNYFDPPHHCAVRLQIRLPGSQSAKPLVELQMPSCEDISLSGYLDADRIPKF